MGNLLKNYKYSKQYILIEDTNSKIKKSLYNENQIEDVYDYLYSIITSVTQKEIDGETLHLIQYEDKELGWLNLNDSIPIFRFQPIHFQIIEEKFSNNELNRKMGIDKDFVSHFKDKILTVKSQIFYKNEKYFSVFIKNKFHGFHHEDHLDKLQEVKIPLTVENLKNVDLYILSNLTKPVSDIEDFTHAQLLSIFEYKKIGKIQIEKNIYWIDITKLTGVTLPILIQEEKTIEQLQYDDLLYSVEQLKLKSKKMLKSIISAKDYINNTEISKYYTGDKEILQDHTNEIKNELYLCKLENLDLKRQLRKSEKEYKLSNTRLEHQIDYNERLEKQRDKYKKRMKLVENNLKNLNEKYKNLKEAKTKKRRKLF